MRLAFAQSVFLGGCLAAAAYDVDLQYKAKHCRAVTVDTTPVSVWRSAAELVGLSRRSQRVTDAERECLQAVVSLFSLDVHPVVMNKMMPNVALYDPWFTVRGVLELRDAWTFLGYLCESATPKVTRVARVPAERDVFYVDIETDFQLRYVGTRVHVPSSVRVTLDEFGRHRRVASIEHRWFGGGPIPGTLSYADSFVSRGVDGLRHLNGFAMSLMMNSDVVIKSALNKATSSVV